MENLIVYWKRVAKKYRKKYLDEIAAQKWVLDQLLEALKNVDEQGAPMTIAGMNTRIAELKKRNKRLVAVCKNTRTAIQNLGYVDAHVFAKVVDLCKALDDHIAREENDEQSTT